MTFKQMPLLGKEENDLYLDSDMFDVPAELITPTNPNAAHQDEPVDPVTE